MHHSIYDCVVQVTTMVHRVTQSQHWHLRSRDRCRHRRPHRPLPLFSFQSSFQQRRPFRFYTGTQNIGGREIKIL